MPRLADRDPKLHVRWRSIYLVIGMAQMIPEATNCVPWNIRLLQFGQSPELRGSLGYLEKADSNGVVRHILFGEDLGQSATTC